MPIYIYKAKKGPVEIINGQIEADSQEHAVTKLGEMGLVPVSLTDIVKAARPQAGGVAPQVTGLVRLNAQAIDTFTRQLCSLIKAGVPVLRALSLISRQTENKELALVSSDLEKQIKEGRMFSEAIAKYPKIFNNLYVNMVKSGEKSGALGDVLFNLAEYREREQEVRRKIQAALAYPLLMLVVGIGTVFVMLTFFMPKFISLFENMKQSLPLPTKILIGISRFMSGNWYWLLMALIVVFAIFGRAKQASKKKFFLDLLKLHLPLVKEFIRKAEIAKFSRTLGLLIKNGISVCEGLDLATDVLDNDALKESLSRARLDIINKGCSMSDTLKAIDIFPSFAVNMIAVGEEGGKIEGALKEISDVYDREVDQSVKIMTSLLEPILILVIGSIVGFIVFAMLLPVFNIGVVVH